MYNGACTVPGGGGGGGGGRGGALTQLRSRPGCSPRGHSGPAHALRRMPTCSAGVDLKTPGQVLPYPNLTVIVKKTEYRHYSISDQLLFVQHPFHQR